MGLGTLEPFDLAENDRKNHENLRPVLADHVWVLDKTFNTIAICLQLGQTSSLIGTAKALSINLMTRLQNELTAVKLLCESGYALQGFAVGAVIYELTWSVAALGAHDSLAQDWFAYSGNLSFKKVKELTRLGLKNLTGKEPSDNEVQQEYRCYQSLCSGKHFNPQLQQTQGFDLEVDAATAKEVQKFACGSVFNQREVIKAWWLIECCIRLCQSPLKLWAVHHIPAENQSQAAVQYQEWQAEAVKLEEDAAKELAKIRTTKPG